MTQPERDTEIKILRDNGWTCKSCYHCVNNSCKRGFEYPQTAADCFARHGGRGFEYEPGTDEDQIETPVSLVAAINQIEDRE